MDTIQKANIDRINHIGNSVILSKAYTEGVYGDTPTNRKLNRVGEHYGATSTKDVAKEKEQKKTQSLETGSYVQLKNGEKGKVIRYASKDDIQVATKENKIIKTSKDQIDSIIDKIEGITITKPEESMAGSDGITINVGDKIKFEGGDRKIEIGIAKFIDKEYIYGWGDRSNMQLNPGRDHVVKI